MPRAKRKTRVGYPVTRKFTTRAEINEYLSQDKVVCLLCGNHFMILDTHLKAVHGISSDDYRESFGIPYTVGLCPSWRTDRDSLRMKIVLAENPDLKAVKVSLLEQACLISTINGQRKKPQFWRDERTKHTKDVWYRFGDIVKSGLTLADAGRVEGMPNPSLKRHAFKIYPDFKKWWFDHVEPVRRVGTGGNLTAAERAKRQKTT